MSVFKLFPGISNVSRLLLLIGLLILGTALSIGLAYLVTIIFMGKDVLLDPNIMLNIGFIRIMQILNQIGVFIMPPLALAFFTETHPGQYLGFNSVKGSHIIATLLLIFGMSPIVSFLMELNEGMLLPQSFQSIEDWMRSSEDKANELVQWMLSYTDPLSLGINALMIILLPAIGEELLFRAVLIRIFKGIFKNIHLAVWISAILFSAFHLQFYGFLPRMFLGLAFGYLFIWSGTIWVPVMAHFINNATVVAVTYLNSNGIITQSPDEFGHVDSPLLIVFSIIMTAVVCVFLYLTRRSYLLFPVSGYSDESQNSELNA
ncbi:MAG TPA: CPBP family intramembrane glutamic endopeptidase [Lentimicrobium sp.]|nr:CPBP family intramembrane glutamic endopeptidase [Lentimicrobium sp.]